MTTAAEKPDVLKMMEALNAEVERRGERSLPANRLRSLFERNWSTLAQNLAKISTTVSIALPARKSEDKIDEILELVRGIAKMPAQAFEEFIPPLDPNQKRYSFQELGLLALTLNTLSSGDRKLLARLFEKAKRSPLHRPILLEIAQKIHEGQDEMASVLLKKWFLNASDRDLDGET